MTVALVEAEPRTRRRRRRNVRARDYLVEARGLRRGLVAATRAGRSPMEIALAAGVHTRSVNQLLSGCTFASESLTEKLGRVITIPEKKLVVDAKGGHVPYSLLAAMVEKAVAEHGVERAARLIGMPSRRLVSLRSGETRAVRLDVADRIVLGLASPILWWDDRELRKWLHASVATC